AADPEADVVEASQRMGPSPACLLNDAKPIWARLEVGEGIISARRRRRADLTGVELAVVVGVDVDAPIAQSAFDGFAEAVAVFVVEDFPRDGADVAAQGDGLAKRE